MSEKSNRNDNEVEWFLAIGLSLIIAILFVGILILDECCSADATFFEFLAGKNGGAIDIFSKVSLVVAGLAGLYFAFRRAKAADAQTKVANRHADIAERGQNVDRLQTAVALLSDESPLKKSAGLHSLKELANYDPEGFYIQVQQLLCSFMREESKKPNSDRCEMEEDLLKRGRSPKEVRELQFKDAPPIISQALFVMSALRTSKNIPLELNQKWVPNLQSVYLAGTIAENGTINLSNADLLDANLNDVVFVSANFKNASLRSTDIRMSNFEFSNFEKAKFTRTKADRSVFTRCNLSESQAWWASFSSANFSETTCTSMFVNRTDYTNASFQTAVMGDSKLEYSDFTGADFRESELRDMTFNGSNMKEALFGPENLDFECYPLGWKKGPVDKMTGMFSLIPLDE